MSQMPTDACQECSEPLARDYGTPVVCNGCWGRMTPEERIGVTKANRNDEQSVATARAKHGKR